MTTRRKFLQLIGAAGAMLALPWKGKASTNAALAKRHGLELFQYEGPEELPANEHQDFIVVRGKMYLGALSYGTVVVEPGAEAIFAKRVRTIQHLVVAGTADWSHNETIRIEVVDMLTGGTAKFPDVVNASTFQYGGPYA